MAQVILLMGLLLLAFLVRRAILSARNLLDRPQREHDDLIVDPPEAMAWDLAALEKQRDDLATRVAVLERLIEPEEPRTPPSPPAP